MFFNDVYLWATAAYVEGRDEDEAWITQPPITKVICFTHFVCDVS